MTNSSTPPCKLGDRIECGNSFGTVKYIGPIEGKPAVWLGIDWDNPERGKHNGSLNGIQYFTTKNPTSGTFVRPEKVNFGKSAIASIESRYGQMEDEFTAKVNQQKQLLIQQTMNAPFLEMVGFDKIFNKQSNFGTLRVVNLRNQNVCSAGPPLKLGEHCPNIEELDISKNLLVSWEDVVVICDQLPKLQWLNVSENWMNLPEPLEKLQYPNLRTVICGSMGLAWSEVCKIAMIFPEIEEFRAPHNNIENLSPMPEIFTKLKLLDLEGNSLKSWAEVTHLGCLPSLEHLNLENIGLTSIDFEIGEFKVPLFKRLKKLCISNNFLNEWTSVGQLNRLESLENLKISKNPITDSEDHETIHQIIIARIDNLKVLNGVEIEPGERRGAEYDYLKKYGLEWLKVKNTEQEASFLRAHNRFLELIEKYGEPEESELIEKPKIIKSSLIQLSLIFEDFSVDKKIPQSLTVQKLTVLAQKVFSLKERPHLTYISSTDAHIKIALEDELKEIAVYSMQDGDKIIVEQ